MSAAATARSIRREDTGPAGRPLDKVRALQWALYRCAKQDPERRFHALYGHVHRMDVLWRAWSSVSTNRGAPGVDGVSIDVVEASGVRAFLQDLSDRLLGRRTYRPAALRRVDDYPSRDGRGRPGRYLDSHCGRPGGDDGC